MKTLSKAEEKLGRKLTPQEIELYNLFKDDDYYIMLKDEKGNLKMKRIDPLPKWVDLLEKKDLNPLEQFMMEHEPSGKEQAILFRDQLINLIKFVV